jgi:TRAP-type C4-dicarboxylate transport system permease small subunit
MDLLQRLIFYLNRGLVILAGIFLLAMILLTSANILLRQVWAPIPGTFELMGFFGAVVTAFTLAHTQINKGHISVDILINRFSKRTRRRLRTFNHAICMVFFGLLAWQVAEKAAILRQTGEVTETLGIIYYPFTFGVAVGCGFLSLLFLTDLVRSVAERKEEGTA